MHVARPQDWLVILFVMGTACALYLSAGFILIRPFIAPKKIRPKLGLMGALVLAATVFSFMCIAYAFFIEPYQLDTTIIPLQFPNLKPDVQLRIVQVSDTHCDEQERLESKVVAEVKRLKPDLILFSGDAANSDGGIPTFKSFAKRLLAIAPTYAVMGDWDFAITSVNVFQTSGIPILAGYKVLNIKGEDICLVGANSGTSVIDELERAPKNLPTIAMYHNPDGDNILEGKPLQANLYLCGHTHGGQIALPFYGAMITQSVQGKKYESGLHKLDSMWTYTSKGIGMEGHFPRLRFFARPELTLFEISGPQASH
ncbi:MAG TPA: metallophosphoesterase [Drouetiella sp.]